MTEQAHIEWLMDRAYGEWGWLIGRTDETEILDALFDAAIACKSTADQHAETFAPHQCQCAGCEAWRDLSAAISKLREE